MIGLYVVIILIVGCGYVLWRIAKSKISDRIDKWIFFPPEDYVYDGSYINSFDYMASSNEFQYDSIETKSGERVIIFTIGKLDHHFNDSIQKCLVFSHDSSSDMTEDWHYFEELANKHAICIVLYDYVGYGISKISDYNNPVILKPNETRCYQSMEAVMNFVINRQQFKPENIILAGHSVGASVVIEYVAMHSWTKPIILFAPFKSICRIWYDHWWVYPFDKFQNMYKLSKVKCPVHIVHGKKDDFVDISHGKYIYNQLPNKNSKFHKITDANHISVFKLSIDSVLKEVLGDDYAAKWRHW